MKIMTVEFMSESAQGTRWYNVHGKEVGLTIDGRLLNGDGSNFDYISGKHKSIINAIEMDNSSFQ